MMQRRGTKEQGKTHDRQVMVPTRAAEPVRILPLLAVLAVAVLLLAGCSAQTMRENWQNRVSGETEVHIAEGHYRVAFLPLASPPGAAADAWVFGPGVSAPFTIPDGGVPGMRISRMDGVPMTRADHENAVAAASAGCADRPGWTPAKAAAIARPVARAESTAYYGTGYLTGGAWVLLGVCK